MDKNMIFIRSKVPAAELLAQLAEEATELAHAALKLRRTIASENPTPVSFDDAYHALLEELADTALLANVYGIFNSDGKEFMCNVERSKLQRWVERLGGTYDD